LEVFFKNQSCKVEMHFPSPEYQYRFHCLQPFRAKHLDVASTVAKRMVDIVVLKPASA